MKKLLFLLLMAVSGYVRAQEFSIKRFELAGDKLIVFYDLIDTVKNRHYTVTVFSSRDNFLNPIQRVNGDVGLEVAPGLQKKIVWNVKEELGKDFAGGVGVEIRGRLYVPFVRFGGFEDFKVRKRGVPFTITWTGGTRQNVLNFDLYNGDTKIWTQAGVGNTGHYELTIPTDVKPGQGYRFKVSDTKNKDEVVYTETFAIKRKVPLAFKVVPVLAVAGAAAFLFKGGSGPATPSEPEALINAPCPDGTNNCN
jgi:Ser-Thr-rich glycosyl-phosphatidyl-inositol-anchored membrane family